MIREPGKRCICEDCAQCHFFRHWILSNDRGEQKVEQKCSFAVLFEEIPRLRGAVDGCQQASNETRNTVLGFGGACVQTLQAMSEAMPAYVAQVNLKLLEK